ncbi:glycosidase [Corynebacterium kutscheri]|uniref:Glycosidase n=1 Tax=Corynebacterium kutscheri TaxID=35755 RepID=A0A0F6R0Q0_9CORY|nr:alpha-amylase family glycosyl hydrolase [Corynebacterium kutscheri]AKE40583.1 glycosidase [Corynebacterium kutscheri]VEH04914.1 Oligo-1,6-glucosidase 1 [Corynebacterium kutscheri]VEH10978.1 Oligo-1,6-glucosidase 1 [Corynebacterium kutscheri]
MFDRRYDCPPWLEKAVFYEIYPQSFCDTNDDGIGDIPGIISKLDYLHDLGITALWLNPLFDSPFKDAGYDVRDYLTVASRYGTNDDLEQLFQAAHQRGIKVLLDLVPGHTSEEHVWFQRSAELTTNEFSDRYIWTSSAFEGSQDERMPFISGESPRNAAYVLNFFKCQPALNFGFAHPTKPWHDHPTAAGPTANKHAIAEVMRYWLSRGADGFRVDMADSLVKNDPEKTETIKVWQDIFALVRPDFPEAAFVSEWGRPWQAFAAGFDMDFQLDWRFGDFHNGYNQLARDTDTTLLRENDISFFNSDSATSAQGFIDDYSWLYSQTSTQGYISLISCNHDTPRLAPRLNLAERSLFFFFLLTMPGVPFIYYGDEIGMRYLEVPTIEGGYARTGSRGNMWPTPPNALMPVDKHFQAEEELRTLVRQLIALRKDTQELTDYHNFRFETIDSPKVLRYYRGDLLVVINVGHTAVEIPSGTVLFALGKYDHNTLDQLSACIIKENS